MRIAIAAQDKNLDSPTSSVAGRAPYYLIFDGKELAEVMENPYAQGGGGAGWGVAKMLADKEVELVLVEQAGSNLEQALEEKGVQIKKISSGTVKKVLEQADKDT